MQNPGVDPVVCLVFEHAAGSSSSSSKKQPLQSSPKLRLPGNVRVVATTFDSPNVLKSEFDRLLQTAQEVAARQVRSRK